MASSRVARQARSVEEERVWKDLVAETVARARALCRNSSLDPEDLAQEALARLLSESERVRNRRAWLVRVMVNLVISELRRAEVRSSRRVLVGTPRAEGSAELPRVEARMELRRVAARLSPDDRRCLRLYASGHSHREIGERLGQPLHRIGPRIARALARVRKSLGLPA